MTPDVSPERYKNHRFPPEIISHAVWLYCRFTLSYRDVQEMLFARGIRVSPMKRSANGITNSAKTTPIRYAIAGRAPVINGI